MLAGGARVILAVWLRLLCAVGRVDRAGLIAYRSRARRLAADARGRIRRWGVWFELNLNDNVQRSFYYTGWYERPFLRFLQQELRPNDTYVDVGAHVGIHAAFVARLVPEGSVIAFEPARETFARLRRSLRRLTNVTVVAAALGDRNGMVALRTNPKWHREDASTWSSIGSGEVVCEAPVVRFDDWAASLDRVDVVKIDAEGAERDVLRGMAESLRRLRPRLVTLELYPPYLEAAGTTEEEIVGFLEDLGYVREQTIGHNAVFRLHGRETAPAAARVKAQRRALPRAVSPVAAAVVLGVWFAKTAVAWDYTPFWRELEQTWGSLTFVLPGCFVLAWLLAVAALASRRSDHARALAGFIPDCLTLGARLLADERVPARRKALLIFLVAYVAIPLDPIPDFIPIVGQLDEVVLFAFVMRRFVRTGGEELVRQHWPGPETSLRLVLRLAGT